MPFNPASLSHETLKKLSKNLKRKFSSVFPDASCTTHQAQDLVAKIFGHDHWHEAVATRRTHQSQNVVGKIDLPHGGLIVEGWDPELNAAVLAAVDAHQRGHRVKVVRPQQPPSIASHNMKIYMRLEDPTETFELFKESVGEALKTPDPITVQSNALRARKQSTQVRLESLLTALREAPSVDEAFATWPQVLALTAPNEGPLAAADLEGTIEQRWERLTLGVNASSPEVAGWMQHASKTHRAFQTPYDLEVWQFLLDETVERWCYGLKVGRTMSVRLRPWFLDRA